MPGSIDEDLTNAEKAVLVDLLDHGDNLPGNLADLSDYHPKHISRCVSSLMDDGLIRDKGRSVYTLTEEGHDVAERLKGTRRF